MSNAFSELSEQIAAAVERAAPSVLQVHAHRRATTGVVFDTDLLVAPARALDDDAVVVRKPNGDPVEGVVLGRSLASGLAVVRAAGLGVAPITRGGDARVGHLAVAVGRTWSGGVMATVSSVAVVGGPLRTGRASRLERVIRIAQAPHGALTGGALIDGEGRAVGLVTGAQIRGTTVVIPAELAWADAASVAAQGGTKQGFLGVSSVTVKLPERQRGDRQQPFALLITGVVAGGPADTAGALVGDVIVALDGTAVHEPEELITLLRGDRVGRESTLRVVRGGAPLDLAVTVGERTRR